MHRLKRLIAYIFVALFLGSIAGSSFKPIKYIDKWGRSMATAPIQEEEEESNVSGEQLKYIESYHPSLSKMSSCEQLVCDRTENLYIGRDTKTPEPPPPDVFV